MKKVCLFLLFSILGLPLLPAYSAEVEDRFLQLRQEELQAKQRRMDELAMKVEAMRNQAGQQEEENRQGQDRVYQEFSGTLEMERRQLQDQLNAIEERERLFQSELEKKRQQDSLRVQEQQNEIQRMMNELDRLRGEIEEDKRMFEERRQEAQALAAHNAEAKRSMVPGSGDESSGEVLRNNAVRISGMKGADFISGGSARAMGDVSPEYYLEIGDVIDIDVWRVPDLTRAISVRPDGRISMPLVGDLQVAGLTLTGLRDLLTQKLSDFVLNPQVSLSVKQFGGRKFIILGEVKSPGVYRFQQDISMLEGIALAGGFTEAAKRGKIMLVRGDVRKSPQVQLISSNIENVLKKGMLTENLTIRSGDVIYVGKDALADYNDIITNLISPTFTTMTDFYIVRSARRNDRRAEGNSSAV